MNGNNAAPIGPKAPIQPIDPASNLRFSKQAFQVPLITMCLFRYLPSRNESCDNVHCYWVEWAQEQSNQGYCYSITDKVGDEPDSELEPK